MAAEISRRRGRPAGQMRVDPEHILDAVLAALPNGGYGALSMRAIARECAVSLATIQHHFGNKEELWKAAVGKLLDGALSGDPAKQDHVLLSDTIPILLDHQTNYPGLWAAVIGDRTEGAEWRLTFLAEGLQGRLQTSAHALSSAQQLGIVRRVDTQAFLALMVLGIGAIGGAPDALEILFGFDVTSERDRRRLGEGIADILTYGLVVDSPD